MTVNFWTFYGMASTLVWLGFVLMFTYLFFVLERRHGAGWPRVVVVSAAGWLLCSLIGSALQVYNELAMITGLPGMTFAYWSSVWYQGLNGMTGLFFVVAALGFVVLGITVRRGKRRVASGGKR